MVVLKEIPVGNLPLQHQVGGIQMFVFVMIQRAKDYGISQNKQAAAKKE